MVDEEAVLLWRKAWNSSKLALALFTGLKRLEELQRTPVHTGNGVLSEHKGRFQCVQARLHVGSLWYSLVCSRACRRCTPASMQPANVSWPGGNAQQS